MPVEVADLERFRDDLLVAVRLAIGESERRIRDDLTDAIATSEIRLETRIDARLEPRFRALEVQGDALGTRIDSLEVKVDSLELKTDTLEMKIDSSAAETRRHMDVVAEDLKSK